MNDRDQQMTKLRLRRLMEAMLDGDLVRVDVEEEEESPEQGQRRTVKRVNLVVRYVPA